MIDMFHLLYKNKLIHKYIFLLIVFDFFKFSLVKLNENNRFLYTMFDL